MADVQDLRWESTTRFDRENKQSRMSWPMDAHRRSAIYQYASATVTNLRPIPRTSRALKMTYSLMVSCPRMEW
jgi:hypothetical protein